MIGQCMFWLQFLYAKPYPGYDLGTISQPNQALTYGALEGYIVKLLHRIYVFFSRDLIISDLKLAKEFTFFTYHLYCFKQTYCRTI